MLSFHFSREYKLLITQESKIVAIFHLTQHLIHLNKVHILNFGSTGSIHTYLHKFIKQMFLSVFCGAY